MRRRYFGCVSRFRTPILKSLNGIAKGTRPDSTTTVVSSWVAPAAEWNCEPAGSVRAYSSPGASSFSAVATTQRADGGLHAASVTAE